MSHGPHMLFKNTPRDVYTSTKGIEFCVNEMGQLIRRTTLSPSLTHTARQGHFRDQQERLVQTS